MKHSTQAAEKPLAGVKVVDFSRLLPGAYCTWILATLGATVIKVEQPGKGDYQRDIGLQAGSRGSPLFQLVNQGKRSISLDLKRPEVRPILTKLLGHANVVVESFRPGVAKRLGIDFDELQAKRPSIVCLSINGFGSNGPLRLTAGHDINYLALSGLMNRQLRAGDGVSEMPFVDLIGGGLIPALSALALLYRARQTGVGGISDTSLADALPLLPYDILAAVLHGLPEPSKEEANFSGAAPNYGIYALRDGYVAVGAVEEEFWKELSRRMAVEFVPIESLRQHSDSLKQELSRKFSTMSRSDVELLFKGADACVTVVKTYGEVFASEHAKVRQYVGSPPAVDTMPRLGSPFFHDGQREFAEGVAPLLGEDTEQVLAELGYTPAEVGAFATSGVAAINSRPDARKEDG